MRLRSVAALSAALLTTSAAQAAADEAYINHRFGFSLIYPSAFLKAEPEAGNGDGRVLRPRRGRGEVRVWAAYDVLDRRLSGLDAAARRQCGGAPVAYHLLKPTFVAMSCVLKSGDILWEKIFLKDGVVTTLHITYPRADQAAWAPVVKSVSGSFRPGTPKD